MPMSPRLLRPIAGRVPPAAPTGVSATAGDTEATVVWSAPNPGTAPITDYIVQYSSDSGATWTTFSDGTSTATTATVTGLTNGTAYIFRVAAVSAVGTGPYSAASEAVTPALPSTPAELLLHFDADFSDSSANAYALSAVYGSPQVTAANSKFGGGSLECNFGTVGSNFASFPSLAGETWTVEAWVYRPTGTSDSTLFALFNSGAGGLHIWIDGSAQVHVDNLAWNQLIAGSVPLDEWVHIAITSSSETRRCYINGLLVGTHADGPLAGPYSYLNIGGWGDPAFNFTSAMLVDDLRVVIGAAVYGSGVTHGDFIVPTAALSANAASYTNYKPYGTLLYTEYGAGGYTEWYADGNGGRYSETFGF